ncbi:MAG: glycoside hydrolase family 3 N-terminal domain-containing protein [Clostridiaceae bacterium]|nr:glycoside hydrolase family 3 C-terminal domain-containing protein [Eubacteriales bacterium]
MTRPNEVEARAEALVSRMTLPEKAAQMMQVPYSTVTREEALAWARLGAGSFLHVLGDDARELQAAALSTRLSIPLLFGIDAIHGHGLNENATIFPSQLAAACSFDRALVQAMGRATAREVATDGLHWTFSPVLCLGRDTRWGRIDETFGEDPYLAGEMGAAVIRGYQGDSLGADDSILACAKHYIGYGEAVGARDACDTEMTYRKLREVFLPPFEKAVRAGCATAMTAYGSIDSTPFTACEKVLRGILKEELGFDGILVTDWDNVQALVTRQFAAANIGEASRMAAEAGNDMVMTSLGFYEAAIALVEKGLLDERVIDDAVRRILRIKLRMGLFEKPEKKGVPGCFACEEHLSICEALARESVVLLKNNGALPLNDIKSVAVIGPNADDIRAQYGDWTYFSHPLPDPAREPKRPYATVLEGVRELADESGMRVSYAHGCGILDGSEAELEEAVLAAQNCDAVVLVLGDTLDQHGEGKDRADLALSSAQLTLFRRLRALKKPLAVVLVASKPLCAAEVAQGADALLCAFNGGMFGGRAVAEAVFGRLNPSGKLPISFPRHSGQLPVYYNYLPGWHGGKYMDLPETPLFAFGEGLSYTRYEYSNLTFDTKTFLAAVDVKNAGGMDGTETVQVYFRDLVSSILTPVKQLIAFERVFLKAGDTKRVAFSLCKDDFSLVTPDERRVTEPGDFVLMVGASSKDEDLLNVTFTL